MTGRLELDAVLEACVEACRGNNTNDHSNTVFEHEIDYNRTHRGLFPDWRSFGQLRVVPLRRVKRGSQASFVIYIRERCPHCGGETTARTGKNYDKNRRSAIRAHLQSCPRWLGHAALPRNRPIGKMMERQGTMTQTSLPWIARSQQPQCAESVTGSADSTDSAASCDSSTDIVQSSTAGVAEWVERLVPTAIPAS